MSSLVLRNLLQLSPRWLFSYATRSVVDVALNEPTLLALDGLLLFLSFLCFRHSKSTNGYGLAIYIAGFLHGLLVELSHAAGQEGTVQWYAQSLLVFNRRRTPPFAILFHQVSLYLSVMTAVRLKLRAAVEPLAIALISTTFVLPFAVVGTRMLWWTWHLDHPETRARIVGVPCVYFVRHLLMASSFVWVFHALRRVVTCRRRERDAAVWRELVTGLLAGFLSMFFGELQMLAFYYYPSASLQLPAENIVYLTLLAHVVIIYFGERRRFSSYYIAYYSPSPTPSPNSPRSRNVSPDGTPKSGVRVSMKKSPRSGGESGSLGSRRGFQALEIKSYSSRPTTWRLGPTHWYNDTVFVAMLVFFASLVAIAAMASPNDVVASGWHQPLPQCNEPSCLFPKALINAEYHFNCPAATEPSSGQAWYVICGRRPKNHAEYVLSALLPSLFAVLALGTVLRSKTRVLGVELDRDPLRLKIN